MHIDLSSITAPATPDAPCTGADVPACDSDAFAALFDEASECARRLAAATDNEDCSDELAALAMSSLLCLGGPVPPPPVDDENKSEACDAAAAEKTTDSAVVADLTDPDKVVDAEWSPKLTTFGSDAEVEAPIDLVKTDAIANQAVEAVAKAKSKATPAAPETGSEKTTADAVENPLAAPQDLDSAPNVQTSAAVTVDDSGARETKASTGKVDADVKPAAKAARPEKSNRSEKGSESHDSRDLEVRAARTDASPAAGHHKAEDVPSADPAQQAPVERRAGSSAARFARALERAAAWATPESGGTASNANTSREDGGQPQGSGDGASSRAAQFSAAIRQSVANTAAFTVHAPAPMEIRSHAAAAAAVAGHTLDNAPMTLPERDVIAQLVQSMRVQFRDGIGEAVLRLKPEHLGSVQISLRVENGALKATVQAEAPAVRQWLESNQDSLRTSLAEHGLRLDRFVVEPEGEPKRSTDDAQQREQEQQRRRQPRRHQPENDTPVFEVTV